MTLLLSISLISLGSVIFVWTCASQRFHYGTSITDSFMMFMLFLFGPHALLIGFVDIPLQFRSFSIDFSQPDLLLRAALCLWLTLSASAGGVLLGQLLLSPWVMRGCRIAIPETVVARRILFIVLPVMAGQVLLFLSFADIRYYVAEIIGMIFRPDADRYFELRRVFFEQSFAISDLLGRTRFSISVLLFVMFLSAWFALRYNIMIAFLIAAGYFMCVAISPAKLPTLWFTCYALLTWIIIRLGGLISRRNLLLLFGVGLPPLMVALSILYMIQYPGLFMLENMLSANGSLALAGYRVFGAVIEGFFLHLYFFPDLLPSTMGGSSGLLADLFNVPTVEPGVEIATRGLGLVTTFPTMFAGAAWADFGYIGVGVTAFVVGCYLRFLDLVQGLLRSTTVRAGFTAGAMLNVGFLVMLPAPATFLSYGLIALPLGALTLDRITTFGLVPRASLAKMTPVALAA